MYLFILESIGTQELILIAGVALIVFGPRKLPQIAKTIGKTMSEFRNATNEFKSTWEKEVNFDEDGKFGGNNRISLTENSIARENRSIEDGDLPTTTLTSPPTPEVKELSAEEAARIFQNKDIETSPVKEVEPSSEEEIKHEKSISAKRNWL